MLIRSRLRTDLDMDITFPSTHNRTSAAFMCPQLARAANRQNPLVHVVKTTLNPQSALEKYKSAGRRYRKDERPPILGFDQTVYSTAP